MTRTYKTLSQVTEEYLVLHPDEVDDFIKEIFADYAEDSDSAALLSALRVVARVNGVSTLAEEVGMSRQGLQKALSSKGNPRLDNVNSIMHAMGYRLMPQPLAVTQ